jgi:alpha-N-arabinofuranosidase
MPFINPVIPGFHPDPSITRCGEDYYLVTSSFEYFPGVPIFHSRDLIHWEQLGHVLSRASQLPLSGCRPSGGIYAPTIRYHDGLFYMITTNVSCGGNLIVHAENPAGPWSEPVYIDHQGIDPSLFFDGDGKVYYTGTGAENGKPGIAMFQIDPMTGKKLSATNIVWHGTGGRYPEGPHLYKIGGWYYLMISEGGTEFGHMVTLARSEAPFGPYEPCPYNPILTHRNEMDSPIAGTGHADLIQAHDGSWWMVFLAYRQSESYFHHLGRETFLCPAAWENGWLMVNAGKPVTLQMDCPTIPHHPFANPATREDFHNGIGPEWNYLRNPDRRKYSFGEDGLTLIGSEYTLNDNASPTFLARRQEQFDGTFRAHLKPVMLSEGAQTGLTVFYGPENHYDFYMTSSGICLKKTIGDLSNVVYYQPWQGECELEISFDKLTYSFAFSKPGEAKKRTGTALTRYVSTEATPCSFTGVYLGAYAQGECEGHFCWIDCDWVSNRSHP